MNEKSLIPHLKALRLGGEFTESPGSQLVAAKLSPTSLTSLSLEFRLNSDQLPYILSSYFSILVTPRFKVLEQLSIREGFLPPRPHQRNPPKTTTPLMSPELITHFSQLHSLRSLSLDPIFVSIELLNVVGELPVLKELKLNGQEESRPRNLELGDVLDGYSDESKREAKFKSLATLSADVNLKSLMALLGTMFPTRAFRGSGVLRRVSLAINGGSLDADGLQTIGLLPDGVESLVMEAFVQSNSEEGIDVKNFFAASLLYASGQRNLQHLSIAHYKQIIMDNGTLGRFLACWPSLRVLELKRICKGGRLDLPDADDSSEAGYLDLTCLDVIARHSPRIEQLALSLRCGDASALRVDPSGTFHHLRSLSLVNSLMDYYQQNFNQHEAAQYVSGFIARPGPGVEFSISQLKISDEHRRRARPGMSLQQFSGDVHHSGE